MKNRLCILWLLAFSVSTMSLAYGEPSSAVHYSHSEVQKMIREAHTPQQFETLASYFRTQQQSFEKQAQSEKQEWERRSQNVTGPGAKYPRPVDSSRNRYEYFAYQAGQMAQQAAHFESLSASAR
jgi:hypothetical protein